MAVGGMSIICWEGPAPAPSSAVLRFAPATGRRGTEGGGEGQLGTFELKLSASIAWRRAAIDISTGSHEKAFPHWPLPFA
jgi:hypothetical protein